MAVAEVLERWRAVCDEVAALPVEALSTAERLDVLTAFEVQRRRMPTVEHRVLSALCAATTPAQLSAANWREVLTERLRISRADAGRRLGDAEELGPRTALTGEPLEPLLPETARRQADGEIGAEHVKIIREFFRVLPSAVDYQTREACEATLAAVAAEHPPEALKKAADRLAQLVNPDGQFSDVDRARRRYVRLGPQEADGMRKLIGLVDPELGAALEAVFATWAAPGKCHPGDEVPCVDNEPTGAQQSRDIRTPGQRCHDALKAIARSALGSEELGYHNGLPATIIVSTTLQELESGAGYAVTGGGSMLPMADVIRLAAHAHHYLAIYDQHTSEPLYLGRTKRLASRGQRIMLHDIDRGCTKPGCTVAGYDCQVHHAALDWAAGGRSDITDETLACGPHNRLVTDGGWRTRKRHDGRTEWIPPPHLDTGQTRVNKYHRPQEY